MCTAVTQGDNKGGASWRDESTDALLFMQGDDVLPWRLRISITATHFELAMPASTPSPYIDFFRLPPAVLESGTLRGLERTLGLQFKQTIARGSSSAYPSSISSPSTASEVNAFANRQASFARDVNAGEATYLEPAEAVKKDITEASNLDRLLEALLAVAPPLFLFSATVSASCYLECRSIVQKQTRAAGSAVPGAFGEFSGRDAETALLQKTNRFFGAVQQIRAQLVQSPASLEKKEVFERFFENFRRLHVFLDAGPEGFAWRGGCMRPTGFGSLSTPPVTMLDLQQLFKTKEETKLWDSWAPSSIQLLTRLTFEPTMTKRNAQCGTFLASVTSSQEARRTPRQKWALKRQMIIDGCRCLVRASYTQVEFINNARQEFVPRCLAQPSTSNELNRTKAEHRRAAKKKSATGKNGAFGLSWEEHEPKVTAEALFEMEPLIVSWHLGLPGYTSS